MNRVKAKIQVNGVDRWLTASSVQKLVDAVMLASKNSTKLIIFSDYATEYMRLYKSNGSIERNTLVGYKGYLNNHLLPFFGQMPVSLIAVDTVQEYANSSSKQYTRKTITEHINFLSLILDSAIEDGLLDKNPCKSQRLKIVGKKSNRVLAYTKEDFKQLEFLMRNLDGTSKLFVALSLYTGMRQGELFGLRWDDVDLDRGIITISRSVEWPSQNKGLIKSPKTENGLRQVVIIPCLLEILAKYYKDGGFVLTSARQIEGEPMTRQAVKRLHERISNKARDLGIDTRFLSHKARHTLVTFMNNAGADDVSITKTVGHSDVNFTKRQYANSQIEQLRIGMERYADYISKP